jgi:hypothetical protein
LLAALDVCDPPGHSNAGGRFTFSLGWLSLQWSLCYRQRRLRIIGLATPLAIISNPHQRTT